MQPKFTQRSFGLFWFKVLALSLIFVAFSTASYSQDKGTNFDKTAITNDAGIPDAVVTKRNVRETPTPDVLCSTVNGTFTATDPVIIGGRLTRNGVASTCAAPKTTCPGFFAQAGNNAYDTYTWTNPTCITQCLTITVVSPAANTVDASVHLGPVNPLSICDNYLGDGGASPATITYSVNVPAGATVTILLTTVTPGTFGGTYTLTLDAATCTAGAPCVGTPNPGNTIASVIAACPTTPVNLSLQNCTPGSGVTYVWQTAPAAAGPWTNASPQPNAPFWSKLQTVATWYRAQVTCGANTGTSTPVFVDQNIFTNCYCNQAAGTNADEDIFNVTFGSLNNTSSCATVAGAVPLPDPANYLKNRYSSYKRNPPGLIVTGNMPFSAQIGTCGGNFASGIVAWLDMNHNGVFDHPAERIFVDPSPATGPHIVNGMITIPNTTLFGVTGLRVVNVETGFGDPGPAGLTPCGLYNWGETEDYLIDVQPCVPLGPVTTPAIVNGECAGIIAIPANTGLASIPSFTWEYRVNASSPWQPAVNGGLGGVITGATSSTLVLINTPSTLNGYQFRALVTNPCTAFEVSNITTINVGPLVARVTPTSATICRGTMQSISLDSPQATFCSGPMNLFVPDGVPNGIATTINVSGIPTSATITEIKITFNMTHTYVGDMSMNLKSPGAPPTNGGTINLLALMNGGTGSNSTADFVNTSISSNDANPPISGAPAPRTGTYRAEKYGTVLNAAPFGPLVTPVTTQVWTPLMNAANINGTWTLGMADLGAIDQGILTSWCITISFGAPVTGIWSQSPVPTTPPVPFGNMWLDPAGTVQYTGGPASVIYVNPISNTSYTVVASTTSPACTSAPVVIPVNVTQPLVSVSNPRDTTVCRGGTAIFTVNASSQVLPSPPNPAPPYHGPFTYVWEESRDNGLTWQTVNNGGIYSGATTNTLTLTGVTREAPSDMNKYRYRVRVSAPPCAGIPITTNSATLTVLALPTVSITASDLALTPGQTSIITGTSSPNPATPTSWSWTLNGVSITNPTGTPPNNTNTVIADINKLGVYRARVTDVNGCSNFSNTVLIESEVSDRLWIYPNPTTGKFQVRWYYSGVYSEIRRIRIFNGAGQLISQNDVPLSNITPHYLRMDFDLSHLAGGVYVVQVFDILDRVHVQGLLIKQ